MAKELNIGVDSIVLVDDNPAERDLVKSRLPSVCCPELSDIESYIRVIDRNGYFEGLVVSKDDLLRNKMYQTDIIRKRTESSFTDYNSYLKS